MNSSIDGGKKGKTTIVIRIMQFRYYGILQCLIDPNSAANIYIICQNSKNMGNNLLGNEIIVKKMKGSKWFMSGEDCRQRGIGECPSRWRLAGGRRFGIGRDRSRAHRNGIAPFRRGRDDGHRGRCCASGRCRRCGFGWPFR